MEVDNKVHSGTEADPTVDFEIDGNVYRVGIFFNNEAKETLTDKIDRLIRRDVAEKALQPE